MRAFLVLVCSPLLATALFWSLFCACIDAPLDPSPPITRLVVTWDPLACGEPHRVVVELADVGGGSVPCNAGSIAIDAPHLGSYRGRVYAQAPGEPLRSAAPLVVTLDQALVYLAVETPR